MKSYILLTALLSFAAAAKLPSSWKKCKRSDPDMNVCLGNAVKDVITNHLKNGEPSLRIGPIEPFRFSQLSVNQGSGPVSVNLTFKNLDIKGMSDMDIRNVNFDWDNKKITLEVFMEQEDFEGDYTINGKILVLPIKGNGKCKISMKKSLEKVTLSAEEMVKDGKTYWNIKDVSLKYIELGEMTLHFENLFNGDEKLGDQMNLFMNENWKVIHEELSEPLLHGVEQGIVEVANRIFMKIPIDEIFIP